MRKLFNVVATLAVVLGTGAGHGAGMTLDVLPNWVGAGVGVTTEWAGAKDTAVALAPGGRVQFSEHRFVEVYGPFLNVNLLNVQGWEFGPSVSYRFGRKDVEDPVVNRLPAINGVVEAGGFGGYTYINTTGVPWRVRTGVSVLTAVGGDTTGTHVTPYASFWMPLSPTVFVGVGGGFTWSSSSFMQQRFGVTPAASAASGLPVYSANSGVRQVYAWPAVIVRLSDHWYGGAGAFYQRLTEDAANSPIVTQRGDRNQWTVGAGIGYGW